MGIGPSDPLPPSQTPTRVAQVVDSEVFYSWTYREGDSEQVLGRGQALPEGSTLALRVQAGAKPVAVLLFNSERGVTPRTQLPVYKALKPHEGRYLMWHNPKDAGKAYVAFLNPNSPEAISAEKTVAQCTKLYNGGGEFSAQALSLYDQVTLWKAEDKGAAVAGQEQYEVGAARPGMRTRSVLGETSPPPTNWKQSAQRLTWKSGQHPVVISRFASKTP